MRALVIALIISCCAVQAQTYVFTPGDTLPTFPNPVLNLPKSFTLTDTPLYVPNTAPVLGEKKTFAQRHPKLHSVGRKFRKTCQVLAPIVSVGGSIAQIFTVFKL